MSGMVSKAPYHLLLVFSSLSYTKLLLGLQQLGWHYPEMAKIVNDNMMFAKCVLRMGMRINCKTCDFSDILADEAVEETLKKTAETSVLLFLLSGYSAISLN